MRLPRRRGLLGSVLNAALTAGFGWFLVWSVSGSPVIAQQAERRPAPAARSRVGTPAATPAAGATNAAPAARTAAPKAAGPKAAAAPAAGLERPAADPLRVDPLPKELQVILEDWEAASSKIVALYGEHRRYVYDKTFSIEKQGQGKLYYESPDRGRYEVEPSVIPKGAKSRKVDKDGNEYTLKPHEPELWVCTGAEVIQVNEDRKEFDRYPIPPEDRGENIMNGPLPFLFGMKAEQARQRYFLALMRDDQQKGEVWIHAKPRMQQDAALWSDAIIILDKETFLPRAVQLVDPAGNQTTVHTFTKLVPKNGFDGIASLIKGNPFEFNPKGYTQRVYEGDGSDLPARGGKPAAGKVPEGNIVNGSPRTDPSKGGQSKVGTEAARTANGPGSRVNN